MAKGENGRNGRWLNWVKWAIGLGLIALGWAYTLGVQGEKLEANCSDDATAHAELRSETRKNSDGLLELKTQYDADVGYIKKGIAEIQQELKK